MKINKEIWNKSWIVILIASAIYFIVRIISLDLLPVFADESIYIRWSQLIISDSKQYLFFPMNDGKTPLQMWLMIPFLKIIANPLWAGRFLSVIVGWGQMIVLYFTIGEVNVQNNSRKRWAQISVLFLSILTPIWFFHQRMALTDALLSLSFSLIIFIILKIINSQKNIISWKLIMTGSLAVAMGFYTKVPAVLFLPTIIILPFYKENIFYLGVKNELDFAKIDKSCSENVLYKIKFGKKIIYFNWRMVWEIILLIGGGIFLFALLRLAPAFSQLFSRGGDFLYSMEQIREIGVSGLIINLGKNLLGVGEMWGAYFGWGLGVLILGAAIFASKSRRTFLILFLSAASIIGPITLLGQLVYPRYYLPAFVPLTLFACLATADLIYMAKFDKDRGQYFNFSRDNNFLNLFLKNFSKNRNVHLIRLLVIFGIMFFCANSFKFIKPAWSDTDKMNFTKLDRIQYLEEWSSGHGIVETVEIIRNIAKKEKVMVLTEGYFGTLPDAVNMYLFNTEVENIYTEGIGQPIREIPLEMISKMSEFDRVLIVVNDYRLIADHDSWILIEQFCRPNGAPCLQVWDYPIK